MIVAPASLATWGKADAGMISPVVPITSITSQFAEASIEACAAEGGIPSPKKMKSGFRSPPQLSREQRGGSSFKETSVEDSTWPQVKQTMRWAVP